jgi:hypothetical protein
VNEQALIPQVKESYTFQGIKGTDIPSPDAEGLPKIILLLEFNFLSIENIMLPSSAIPSDITAVFPTTGLSRVYPVGGLTSIFICFVSHIMITSTTQLAKMKNSMLGNSFHFYK